MRRIGTDSATASSLGLVLLLTVGLCNIAQAAGDKPAHSKPQQHTDPSITPAGLTDTSWSCIRSQ